MSNQYNSLPIEDRFKSRVLITPTCWLWIGCTDGTGRGTIKYEGRQVGAHRISWKLHRGLIPDGLCVLHRCDVPTCVNPEHLFLGTQAENMMDMKQKGRQARGEKQGSAKLTVSDVEAIRLDRSSQALIAWAYGISQTQVSRIKLGERWAHLQRS